MDKQPDKKKTSKPVVPTCPACNKTMLHCTCKNNELKK